MSRTVRQARPRRWPGAVAWALWALAPLALVAVPWSDRLLRQAGHPELAQFNTEFIVPALAVVSGATVGAIVASRRPRHPVGWLLLAVALSLVATGAAAQYLVYEVVRPGALPAVRYAAVFYPVCGLAALTLISFVLLLTPTGSLPSPRWRWWAALTAATPVVLLLVMTLVGGPSDPRSEVGGSPFDFGGLGGVLLVANQVAVAIGLLAVVAAAASLVVRFRRAQGVERQQLRWVALAVPLVVVAVLVGFTLGARDPIGWGVGVCLPVVPLAIGAAILRYRLYDLDRIISRTLAYGLLTVLLGGAYAGVVLGFGQLFRGHSSLLVAGSTLALAVMFRPARRRVQLAVDRRFNRRRSDAARTIEGFGVRLRQQIDLDSLTRELLAVVDQTMQPTQVSLWLRPSVPVSQDQRSTGAFRAAWQPTTGSTTANGATRALRRS